MLAAYSPAFSALSADLFDQLGRNVAETVDLVLVGIELPGDEGAHRVDDRPLLVVEPEVHASAPSGG